MYIRNWSRRNDIIVRSLNTLFTGNEGQDGVDTRPELESRKKNSETTLKRAQQAQYQPPTKKGGKGLPKTFQET